MNEEFLHFIWKHSLFSTLGLNTTQGIPINIIDTGELNIHSGPDFFASTISLGNEKWVGNVEIHLMSSEWEQHGHQVDKAYDSVILHVVFEDDKTVHNSIGSAIPTLELKDRIDKSAFHTYQHFLDQDKHLPCKKHLANLADQELIQNLLRLECLNRLNRKSQEILQLIDTTSGNLKESFYRTLARNFGFHVNGVPFGLLASNLPLNLLEKNQFNPFTIEALVFGVAGFLESDYSDPYPFQLSKEFKFLQKKYGLNSLPEHIWKKSKMRPNNFPVIRLAQFSALMARSKRFFELLSDGSNTNELLDFLLSIRPHPYWRSHYMFDKNVSEKSAFIGTFAAQNILINTIAPFIYAKGHRYKDERYQAYAGAILEALPAEQNRIISDWKRNGIKPKNAAESQALIQLRNEKMCSQKMLILCHRRKIHRSTSMIRQIFAYFEKKAFGVCAWWGKKLGVKTHRIRLFFIYLSFITFGSILFLYLLMAFVLEHKRYFKFKKKRPSVWDI